MNNAPANSPGLAAPRPPGEGWRAGPQPGAGWSRNRWLAIVALAFAVHVVLVFLFGEKKPAVPRAVTNVPLLTLANEADELLALNDPTLFALPHQRDFAAAGWLNIQTNPPPDFRYTEPPRWLPLSADGLGAAFGRLMPANSLVNPPLDFKPAPMLITPATPMEPALPPTSTMQIEGELAPRQLPAPISLTNWPFADVLSPCVVQVLVDAAGNVVSTVVLKSSDYKDADDKALELARTLRFKPAASLTIGQVTFNWHTVPPVNETNR